MADLEKFMYGTQDDTQLRQKLVAIAKDFGCTDGAQNEWISYFENPANIQGIIEAKAKYGFPSLNRKSWRSGGLFGKWHDYCDWGDTYRFYYYAKIAQDYPALNPENKKNCYIIKGFIDGLEQERVNVTKLYAIKNDGERYKREMEVIGEKLNDFNSLYSSMLCDSYIAEQDRLIAEAQRTKALEQSQKINVGTFQQTAGTSGGGTKLALYVFGGVAALIGIMLLARKKPA
jgi:hypothetical protein|tara:strand:+ start:273 stop:965 length:693 start_codon:yes stop_codon:yes gene_type:complete